MAGFLPVPNPTKSFWIEEANDPLRWHRTTEDLPDRIDVAIIGSGYSGATVAHWLTKYTSEPPSMLMLEARDVCSGATGRNGGHLKPEIYLNYPTWSKLYGAETALSLADHEIAHLAAFEELVKEEKLDDAEFVLTRSWDVLMSDFEAERSFGAYEMIVKEQGEGRVKGVELHKDQKEAEKLTRIRGIKAAISRPAGQIWPYKFVCGLLRNLIQAKRLNLQTNTPVTAVASAPDAQGYTRVETARGVVLAKKVVHATNGYIGSVLQELQPVITPFKGAIAAITPCKAWKDQPINFTYGQRWDGLVNNYMIQLRSSTQAIIIGGGEEATQRKTAVKEWDDNIQDDIQIPRAAEYFAKLPGRDFIEWEGDSAESMTWTGVLSRSKDGFPWIGPHPSKESQFVLAGFNGHGMPRILLSAAYIAPLVLESLDLPVETPKAAQAFPPLPEPFKLTSERLARVGDPNAKRYIPPVATAVDDAQGSKVAKGEVDVTLGSSRPEGAEIPEVINTALKGLKVH